MSEQDNTGEVIQQIELGIFKTQEITLATSLMTADFPGIELFDVLVEPEPWPKDKNPRCIFRLSIAAGQEAMVMVAIKEFWGAKPRGLPISNSGDYDYHKKKLIDKMRQARALANRERQK